MKKFQDGFMKNDTNYLDGHTPEHMDRNHDKEQLLRQNSQNCELRKKAIYDALRKGTIVSEDIASPLNLQCLPNVEFDYSTLSTVEYAKRFVPKTQRLTGYGYIKYLEYLRDNNINPYLDVTQKIIVNSPQHRELSSNLTFLNRHEETQIVRWLDDEGTLVEEYRTEENYNDTNKHSRHLTRYSGIYNVAELIDDEIDTAKELLSEILETSIALNKPQVKFTSNADTATDLRCLSSEFHER